jgi:hypothetical protein
MLFKKLFEAGSDCSCPSVGHRAQFQNVTAKLIADGEWFAALAFPAIPPTFEIDCPNVIRLCSFAPGEKSAGIGTPPHPAMLHPARFIENTLEGAFARHLQMPPGINRPDLLGAPRRREFLQTNDLTEDILSQLPGVAAGTPRSIVQPGQPVFFETLQPLVTSLGADPLLLAQRPKVLRFQGSQHKLTSQVHHIPLLPWHPLHLPNTGSKVLPMF